MYTNKMSAKPPLDFKLGEGRILVSELSTIFTAFREQEKAYRKAKRLNRVAIDDVMERLEDIELELEQNPESQWLQDEESKLERELVRLQRSHDKTIKCHAEETEKLSKKADERIDLLIKMFCDLVGCSFGDFLVALDLEHLYSSDEPFRNTRIVIDKKVHVFFHPTGFRDSKIRYGHIVIEAKKGKKFTVISRRDAHPKKTRDSRYNNRRFQAAINNR